MVIIKLNDLVGNYLDSIGSELYEGDTRLFANFKSEDIDFSQKTIITVGKGFIAEATKVQITHTELMEHGYHIIQRKSDDLYCISGIGIGKTVKALPNIKIILDTKEQKVQLEGASTSKNVRDLKAGGKKSLPPRIYPEVYTETDVVEPDYNQEFKGGMLEPEYDELEFDFLQDMGDIIKETKEKFVDTGTDVAFMVSINNELVCFEKDPPDGQLKKILAIGDSSAGKSKFAMRYLSEAKNKWVDDWWFGIDPLNQFHVCYEGMKHAPFVRSFAALGEKPLGLPICYFRLASNNVTNEYKKMSHFLYPLDTLHFFNNYKYFTKGVDKWALKGTERYIKESATRLSRCNTKEKAEEVLASNFPETTKSGSLKMGAMIKKMCDGFDSIYSYKFLNCHYNKNLNWKAKRVLKENDELVTKEYSGDPLIASMFAGCVVFLGIDDAKMIPEDNQACSRNILADCLQKFLKYKRLSPENKSQRIHIFFDEWAQVYAGHGGKGDNLTTTNDHIFTQGRFQNFGYLATKQGLEDLSRPLIQNCTTLISGQVGDHENRRLIGNIFRLPKEQYDQLGTLRKTKGEVVAIQKEPFIVYDKHGNRKTGKKFYRGNLIPPTCNTLKTGGKKKDENT